MYKLFIIIIFCLFNLQLISQKQNKATLIKSIDKEQNPLKKIDLMLELTYNYIDSDSVNFINTMKNIKLSSISNNYTKGLAEYYYKLGDYFYKKAKYQISSSNYKEAVNYFNKSQNKKRIADAYTCISVNYSELSMFNEAIEPLIKSEKIYQELHDTTGLIQSEINIGANYGDIKLNNKATKYYLKALELALKVKDYESAVYCYSNLGVQAKKIDDFDKALEYYIKLETYAEQSSNKMLLGYSYNNISNLFLAKNNPYKAYQFANKYYKLYSNSNDPNIIFHINSMFGNSEIYMGNYKTGINHLEKAFNKAKEINAGSLLIGVSNDLADAYKKTLNFNKAFYYKNIAYNLADSIFKAENLKQLTEVETKYQTEKKEHEIDVLNKDKKLQTLELERKQKEIKQRNIVIYGIAIVLLIIVGFSALLYKALQQKRKANKLLKQKNVEIQQKNEEILAQRDEIQTQRDEVIVHRDKIASQQKKITDSILYASRIQNAVLPPDEIIDFALPEHFILFKPRDIVSGDFYWLQQIENRTYIAVADCTGHGVPGAFMSMMGVAFLNEIITKFKNPSSGEILNQLRINVKRSLHQTGRIGEQKDGMDISLCVIDTDKKQIEFSGANNPLYIVKSEKLKVESEKLKVESEKHVLSEVEGLKVKSEKDTQNNDNANFTNFMNFQLYELKGDKMPIGVHTTDDKPFNTQLYSYNIGDTFYMFSDGYQDQFGGNEGKKFMKSRFKKFLLEINNLSINEQKKQLEYNIERWMGNHEQVDDILVIGVRIV